MSMLDEFLNADMSDYKEFTKKFILAALETRGKEMNLSYEEVSMEGDYEAYKEIDSVSVRPHNYILPEEAQINIPKHLNKVINYLDNEIATTFRGTRLPDTSSSFQMGFMHTTPQLTIANAYANGDTNNSTGIGRIGNEYELGFIHSYEVPLHTKSYKNFEFEDIQKNIKPETNNTLESLKASLSTLSKEDKESFCLDSERIPSDNMKKWFNVMESHYEVVIDEKTPVQNTYLKYKRGILKVDLNNPQWDKLLARYQEANLKDLYEIRPIEMIMKNTKNVSTHDNIEN